MRKFVSETGRRPRQLPIIRRLVVSNAQADDLSFHHCQCLILATGDWYSLSLSLVLFSLSVRCGLDIFFFFLFFFLLFDAVLTFVERTRSSNVQTRKLWEVRASVEVTVIKDKNAASAFVSFLTYTTCNKAKSCARRERIVLFLWFSFFFRARTHSLALCSFVTARNHHYYYHYSNYDRNHHQRVDAASAATTTTTAAPFFFSFSPSLLFLFVASIM